MVPYLNILSCEMYKYYICNSTTQICWKQITFLVLVKNKINSVM